ncbi:hypothetical protein J7M23_08785, partial [Candidatus Sumerlaeota bacterium]|nr:hypothetical protein [Candidatus Sumerlaeota bacterium]
MAKIFLRRVKTKLSVKQLGIYGGNYFILIVVGLFLTYNLVGADGFNGAFIWPGESKTWDQERWSQELALMRQ